MQFDRNQAAAGPLNGVVNRLRDILPTVIRVAEVLHDADLSARESQLMLRLQLGLPAVLVPIAMDLGTDLSRAQYLALSHAGLTTPNAIKSADTDQLLTMVDGDDELRRRLLSAAEQLEDVDQAA